MAWKKYAKKYARKAVRAGIRYARKRYVRGGRVNVSKISRDVYKLKTIINSERKRYVSSYREQPIGQISALTASTITYGAFYSDITPTPAEGATFNGRTGASIKLSGIHFKCQLKQQANTTQSMKFKCYIVENKGIVLTAAQALPVFIAQNPFVTLSPCLDLNSERNLDYMGDFKVLSSKTVFLAANNISTQTMIKDFSMGLKCGLGHHVRFNGDSNTVTKGQIFLFIVADCGNSSATALTTVGTGLTVIGANTGALLSINQTSYYYDN